MAATGKSDCVTPVTNEADFDAHLGRRKNDVVIVLFHACWSAHRLGPDELVSIFKDTSPPVFKMSIDVDDEEASELALALGVTANIPVCWLMHGGSRSSPLSVIVGGKCTAATLLASLADVRNRFAPESQMIDREESGSNADKTIAPAREINPSEGLVRLLTCSQGHGAVRLFVAGDKTHCGKTTVALGILGNLVKMGVPPEKLAYIKPATQCESPDLLLRWCEAKGVAYCGGSDAPLVFYSGFTRQFLEGNQGTSAGWIDEVRKAVEVVSEDKWFVLIDGVGFPAVGSVVGVSNAEVALASTAPVVIVGKAGVGGAIDAHTLNATFFNANHVPVLGGIFNRAATEGFYRQEVCKENIEAHFRIRRNRERVFGVLPDLLALADVRESVPDMATEKALALAELNIDHVGTHVDVTSLILEAALDPWNRRRLPALPSLILTSDQPHVDFTQKTPNNQESRTKMVERAVVVEQGTRQSRAQIEAHAKAQGAKGG